MALAMAQASLERGRWAMPMLSEAGARIRHTIEPPSNSGADARIDARVDQADTRVRSTQTKDRGRTGSTGRRGGAPDRLVGERPGCRSARTPIPRSPTRQEAERHRREGTPVTCAGRACLKLNTTVGFQPWLQAIRIAVFRVERSIMLPRVSCVHDLQAFRPYRGTRA